MHTDPKYSNLGKTQGFPIRMPFPSQNSRSTSVLGFLSEVVTSISEEFWSIVDIGLVFISMYAVQDIDHHSHSYLLPLPLSPDIMWFLPLNPGF